MTRKIIDMTKDPRGGQFEYFRTMTDPWAGITVPVDITDLLASLNGRPFFLSYLYAVMRAANAVPELRRSRSGLFPYRLLAVPKIQRWR